MIDIITGSFEITQYDVKKETTIGKLVETTWLSRYPWPAEITYGRGSESLSHKF